MTKKIIPLLSIITLAIGGIIAGYFLANNTGGTTILFNTASATGAVASDDNVTFCASGSLDIIATDPVSRYLIIDVLNNDTGTGVFVHQITQNPTYGQAIISGSNSDYVVYVLTQREIPTSDSFMYEACAQSGATLECDTATVNITFDENCNNTCTDDQKQECIKYCVELGGNETECTNFCENCDLIQLPQCGNGTREHGEQCDDGNLIDRDGCHSNCQTEYPVCQTDFTCKYQLENSGTSCESDSDCNPANSICGNGNTEPGEQCDDGNLIDRDGCHSNCQKEYSRCQTDQTCGYQLSSAGTQCNNSNQCIPTTGCGDGHIQTGEQCDDGNNINYDGCSATCQLEYLRCQTDKTCSYQTSSAGEACSIEGSVCGTNNPICGNHTIEEGEQCDDGNTTNNDGCSSSCQREYLRCLEDKVCGYQLSSGGESCTIPGNTCQDVTGTGGNICGNGTVEGDEQCDDGNTNNADGCDSICKNEKPSCSEVDINGPTTKSSGIYIKLQKDDNDRPIKIKKIKRGDGNNDNDSKSLPQSHYYHNHGEFTIEFTVYNTHDESLQSECSETVIINTIAGCTDSSATNYNPNATQDDGSCAYNGGTNCNNINFNVTNNSPTQGETVFFSRNNNNIKNAGFYAGEGNFQNNIQSPANYRYNEGGEYNAQLIITDEHNNTETCYKKITVTPTGCMEPLADNYNPQAVIDDGSCVFHMYKQCGDNQLQGNEECDDGNQINGDGCSQTCKIEVGYIPYCGNNILEQGEQCDGGNNCTSNCNYESSSNNQLRGELCKIYGMCQPGENNIPTPPSLPIIGPDEDRAKKQFLQKGIEFTQNNKIDISNIDRYQNMKASDQHFYDPLYRINHILPQKYNNTNSYIVVPSIGTVVPIQTIKDKQILSNFIMGNIQGYQQYLQGGAVYYPFTPLPGQPGNTVIFGHSSQYKKLIGEDNAGNVFKLLPLVKRGEYFYLVTRGKNQKDFTIRQYQVNDKKIISPKDVDIIGQNIVGQQITLMTCYPIGTNKKRYIVTGVPVNTLQNMSYDDLKNYFNEEQEEQLQNISIKYLSQYSGTDKQLIIDKIQKARNKLINNNHISIGNKLRRDKVWQYILYNIIQKS